MLQLISLRGNVLVNGRGILGVSLSLILLIGISFGLGMGSTTYETDALVSSGGGNTSSTTYESSVVIGVVSGSLSGATYDTQVGFYEGAGIANNAPESSAVYLNSSGGSNKTLQNLNCYSEIVDSDDLSVTAYVVWYKDDVENLSLSYSGQTNGTNFTGVLNYGNTTKGETWKCSVRFYDGSSYSSWTNSSGLVILNSAPTVSLSSPEDYSDTTERTPEFVWVGSDDDDDSLTYDFNISAQNYTVGADVCSDTRTELDTASSSYTPSSDLSCLYDSGYYYVWTVRANDGEVDGDWAASYHLNVSANITISFVSSELVFGSLNPGDSNDTSDDSPSPFVIQNDGNSLINVSLNATSLWDSVTTTSDYFRLQIGNVSGEEGAFNFLTSLTSWFQAPINSNVVAIDQLNYTAGNDSARIDVAIQVPSNEPASAKSSLIVATSQLAE